MSSLAMTVPYMRTSPLHIPRRDLVLGRADSLSCALPWSTATASVRRGSI